MNTKKQIKRSKFLENLGESMFSEHLKRRAYNPHVKYKTRLAAAKMANIKIQPNPTDVPQQLQSPPTSESIETRAVTAKATRIASYSNYGKLPESAACVGCLKLNLRKKTRLVCQLSGCHNFSCDEHSIRLCNECAEEQLQE